MKLAEEIELRIGLRRTSPEAALTHLCIFSLSNRVRLEHSLFKKPVESILGRWEAGFRRRIKGVPLSLGAFLEERLRSSTGEVRMTNICPVISCWAKPLVRVFTFFVLSTKAIMSESSPRIVLSQINGKQT